MAKSLWQEKFVITAYNLAKSGKKDGGISKILGISHACFCKWLIKKKRFKEAVSRGRKEFRNRNNKVLSFRDYVYKRLPLKLRRLWTEIDKLDSKKNGGELIETLLANKSKNIRKHLFIHALVHCNFAVSPALRMVNLAKGTFDDWKKNDPEFGDLVKEIQYHKKNFFEDHLCKLVASGDTAATIFVNKTFNRDRYPEKQDLNINMSGELNSNVSIDALNLPLQVKKEILKSIRETAPT